jgi:hypothetical protein
MSVVALKNTFADIRSIEFKYTDFNAVTGSYGMEIEMGNLEGKSVEFDYSFSNALKKYLIIKLLMKMMFKKKGRPLVKLE